jgi:hypothetical protein
LKATEIDKDEDRKKMMAEADETLNAENNLFKQ